MNRNEIEVDRIDLTIAGYADALAWFEFYAALGCRHELEGHELVFYTAAVSAEQAA